MAYVAQKLPKEDENFLAQQGQTTPTPTATGGGEAPEAPMAVPGVGSPTQFGSSASKLSDYLRVNAPQVAAQGEQIAGKVRGQQDAARGAVDTAGQKFGQDVAAGFTPPNQGLIDEALANPTEFVKTPGNVDAFKSQTGGKYAGPSGFESSGYYADVADDVSNAVRDAEQFKTPAGLSSYLKSTTSGTYTPGMASLDASLLRGNPEAFSKIRAEAEKAPALTSYLADTMAAQNKAVADARAAAGAGGEAARAALAERTAGFESGLDDLLTSTKEGSVKALSDAAAKLNKREALTPAEMSMLNVTPETLAEVYKTAQILKKDYGIDVDISQYLIQKASPDAITRENLATGAQYDEAAALAQLAGVSPSFLTGDTRDQAGTAITDFADLSGDTSRMVSNSLNTKDKEVLGGLSTSLARSFDNTVMGYDPRNIWRIKDLIAGNGVAPDGVTWQMMANDIYKMSVPQMLSILKASIRQGRLGADTQYSRSTILTPSEEAAILSM